MAKYVYENSVTEWFIAESAAQAAEECKKLNTTNGCPVMDDELDLDFTQTPDDKVLTMEMQKACCIGINDEPENVTMTAREFADKYPIGFLGTTEY